MDEYDQIEADWMERHPSQMSPGMQVQLFPLSLAQPLPLSQVAPEPEPPILQRRVAGLPVWGWGLGVVGAGVAYWLYSKSQSVTPNTGAGEDLGGDDSPPAEGWKTSRTSFCQKLRPFLQKNGIMDKTTIYDDADEAAKKLKQVSPLVTIQCKAAKVPLKELDKFARREGLTATAHDNGVVGFYPAGGKKGKAWEEYIDALREEGQKV